MKQKCDYCINKEQCGSCDKSWHDRFIPSEDVKRYFNYGYNGVRGIRGYTWDFDTTDESLESTHSVLIGNTLYCPYCGNQMYPIQDRETLATIGHCCICEGARAELAYEKRRTELLKKHDRELHALMEEYRDKLSFCAEKLLGIKQERERKDLKSTSYRYSHFSTHDGKACDDIRQML